MQQLFDRWQQIWVAETGSTWLRIAVQPTLTLKAGQSIYKKVFFRFKYIYFTWDQYPHLGSIEGPPVLQENFSLIPVITVISVVITGYFFNQPVNPAYLFRMCVLYKPLVFDAINQYYSTCQSLLLLCLGWDKVELRTLKSLSYYNLPGWTTTRIV